MMKDKLNYKLLNFTALMLLLYIGFSNVGLWLGIIQKIVDVLSPFIVAFVFSYALTPFVKKLEEKGLRHGLSVVVVVFGLVLIVVGLFAVLLPLFYDQLVAFATYMMEFIQDASDKLNINLGSFEIKITDYLNEAIKELGTIASSTTFDLVSKSIDFISKFIVGFVGFIYFLADMEKIRRTFKDILKSISNRSYAYVKCLDGEISNYLKGLGIFMIIQLFEYSILFLIVGHPNWLILGILACLTTIIPYFGGLITNIIAVVTASVVSTPLFIATIIICLIFPQLDGYVISPKVYGKTNDVNPLITIMVISVGGTIAGIVGIACALPCYLLIRTTYQFFKKDITKGVKKVKKAM